MSERRPGQDKYGRRDRDSGRRRDDRGRQRNRRAMGDRKFSANAPSQRTRRTDPARLAAFRTLRAVAADDAYGNLVLPEQIRRLNLNRRDAGLATELAYGALRHQGTWDAILAECVDRPLAKIDPPVLDALRLGVHQLLAMRIPDHAALDQTVGLTRAEIGAGPSGLVNAVLRKVMAHDLQGWLAELTRNSDDVGRLALEGAHPVWIVRALRQALAIHGRSTAEIADLLAADNAAPSVHLVALPGLGNVASVVEDGATISTLAPDAAVSAGGDLHRVEAVRDGLVRVQDIGSQLVARSVVEASPVLPGEKWLDLCAGPGGKAALLAALAAEHGAHLTAIEVAEHRAQLVRQALDVVEHSAWTVQTADGRDITGADAGQAQGPPGFDRILVDAPCTGLGALRRRPEARWRRTPQDLAELTVLQAQLLQAAADALRPGGLLVYATCSPHAAETIVAVEDVLKARPELQLVDAGEPVRGAALPGALDGEANPAHRYSGSQKNHADGAATVQLWPHVHGTDAMFIAHFRKNPGVKESS
ncbi:RsmB/NOP family class I SAM-dependent RNA methyltransferase [Kocuria sp.]|uniref:RsmB/NOP family class I SAM-dependent RNA methyltransferase n=1 Tax=Kocuria sp. TaxID=1871328 RepID=UPI0026DFBD41|nr:transcription antitermination factor NusB [Kocuria sp.]MDO5619818.1 transcription antitermination factor NusB [Kocuria sp.]